MKRRGMSKRKLCTKFRSIACKCQVSQQRHPMTSTLQNEWWREVYPGRGRDDISLLKYSLPLSSGWLVSASQVSSITPCVYIWIHILTGVLELSTKAGNNTSWVWYLIRYWTLTPLLNYLQSCFLPKATNIPNRCQYSCLLTTLSITTIIDLHTNCDKMTMVAIYTLILIVLVKLLQL